MQGQIGMYVIEKEAKDWKGKKVYQLLELIHIRNKDDNERWGGETSK